MATQTATCFIWCWKVASSILPSDADAAWTRRKWVQDPRYLLLKMLYFRYKSMPLEEYHLFKNTVKSGHNHKHLSSRKKVDKNRVTERPIIFVREFYLKLNVLRCIHLNGSESKALMMQAWIRVQILKVHMNAVWEWCLACHFCLRWRRWEMSWIKSSHIGELWAWWEDPASAN